MQNKDIFSVRISKDIFTGTILLSKYEHAETSFIGDIKMRIATINFGCLRLYFVNKEEEEVSIPEHVKVKDMTNKHFITPFQNSFILAWMDDYHIVYKSRLVARVFHEREVKLDFGL